MKHPLGRYLPICSMWHAVFNTCTVEEFMHGPMHKNDTPWLKWLNSSRMTGSEKCALSFLWFCRVVIFVV